MQVRAQANNRVLGKRLRGDAKKVSEAVSKLTKEEIEQFQKDGKIEILGHVLTVSRRGSVIECVHPV